MKIPPAFLLLAVGGLVAPTLSAQEPKAPTVNELVSKNVEAKGGAEALKSLASVKLTGKMLVNGGQFELAYSQTKLLLTREQDMDLAAAIEMDALVQALLMKSHDHGEFYRAWSDGRKPEWAGR